MLLPDLLVIEGPKARGGHLGFHREQLEMFTDETYAREVKILAVVRGNRSGQPQNIPVVLAGGIYDRADMDRALALAWMAYRWGHALSRHTSVTQICLINRRTSAVKRTDRYCQKPCRHAGSCYF